MKLLLTCRKQLGIADEMPLTIAVPQLTNDDAKQLLRNMARVPEVHAASIAELYGCLPLDIESHTYAHAYIRACMHACTIACVHACIQVRLLASRAAPLRLCSL